MTRSAGTSESNPQHRIASPIQKDVLLIGDSKLFHQVLSVADAVSANDCVVLIEGESGTGKELVARRIHQKSPRRDGPFIPVNCAGISESLFESQLFGHVRGSFTGASSSTLGVVRAAQGGTLLLDEIGEIPLNLQPKLLRLLQEREVTPVGASQPIHVDVRFVASTNRCLLQRVYDGQFRADLYHRLNIARIEVPPLRTRPEDVDSLLDFYIEYFAAEYGRSPVLLSESLRRSLRQYHWPGNVRELCAYLERLYATDTIPLPPGAMTWDDGYTAPEVATVQTDPARHAGPDDPTGLDEPEDPDVLTDQQRLSFALPEVERRAIERALRHANWNRSLAAKLLTIHRSTLIRKIRQLGIPSEDQGRA